MPERRFLYSDGKWYPFEERAEKLLRLEPDWDSYGAPVIDAACIRRARRFLEIVKPSLEPMLGPTSSGGVELRFECGADSEAVLVEFDPSDEDTLYVDIDDFSEFLHE